MTMPRLHTDDLNLIIAEVSKNLIDGLKPVIVELSENSDQTYTVDQVAKLTNKDRSTVISHIKKGLLEAARTGKNYSITALSLKKYTHGE